MEETRYQVFVSSTFFDLQDERAGVVSALLQMDAFPAGMELFPAANEDAWTLIKRVIDSSDYYLLVIGGRYGSMDAETELSYTEMEYDYALDQGKPVMAFLHADPDKIEFGKSEKGEAARAKLDAFREKVKNAKHVKFWTGPEDLAGKVALSFADFRKTYPAVGWIRGDVQTSTEALSELNQLRKSLAETEARLATEQAGPPPGSEQLAQGTEKVTFQPGYEIDVSRVDDSPLNSVTESGLVYEAITWDDLFSAIGPEMLDEADEPHLRQRIAEWLMESFGQKVEAETRANIEADGERVRRINSLDIEFSTDDFGTMIVQFRALGLIEKSERQRSVKDTATYWKITPLGDQRLTSLRAIRRPTPAEA